MVIDVAAVTVTDTQSYSQVIRDALYAKVVQLPFFEGFVSRRSRQLLIQEPLLPYLGVYIIGEEMPPDGDLNAGDIRFIHSLRIGFQVIIENNDPVQSELTLDAAFWAIMNGLWTDANLTNFIESDMPDNTRIEGVERGTRRHVWGTAGSSTNEKPIGELEYIASLRYRTEWYPSGFPDLLDIHVETVPLADDGTVPDASTVQRIITEYEFTPAKGGSRDRSNNHGGGRSGGRTQEADRGAQGDDGQADAEAAAGARQSGE
jgi:hypothetical protein